MTVSFELDAQVDDSAADTCSADAEKDVIEADRVARVIRVAALRSDLDEHGDLTGPASMRRPATMITPPTSAVASAAVPLTGMSVANPPPRTMEDVRVTRMGSVSS